MRQVVLASLGLSAVLGVPTSFAADVGLPTRTFVQSWTAMPTEQFSPDQQNAPVKLIKTRIEATSDAQIAPLLGDAFSSARDEAERRALALSQMTTSWDQEKRSAFQRLRDAEIAYAGPHDARNQRFVATLARLVDGTGRSAASDGSASSAAVDTAYSAALAHSAGDDRVATEASQAAWRNYRDAFAAFADIQQPGSADGVTAELDRQRAADLAALAR